MESPQKLTIALDYDGTYTADRDMWNAVIAMMQLRGHRVVMVTARLGSDEDRRTIKAEVPETVPVYYTGLRSKIDYMRRQGVVVSIWIDDDPPTLVHGH